MSDYITRGTTPSVTFELPFDVDALSEAWITFSQNKTERFTKVLGDCEADGAFLTVKLTQEETLKLKDGFSVQIQIRAKTEVGEAIASDIVTADVGKILKDGVI